MISLPNLHVLGTGAVSPAGLSTESLLLDPEPPLNQEALLSQPEKKFSVRKVDFKHQKFIRWQQEPRLRRASPLALFLMEAASQALEKCPELDRSRLGLVCALGTGSISYSRRFYTDTLKRGRRFASPALFPETVYNSPVSHVASILGIDQACYSLVGDESAWVEALRVAQVWLALGKVSRVLVLAGEELDVLTLEAYYRMGWLRNEVVPSEGAGALLVQAANNSETYLQPDTSTLPFRSRASHFEAWKAMTTLPLGNSLLVLPGNVVPASQAKTWSPHLPRSGPDWGAAFTASSSWASLQMIQAKCSGTLLVPGFNSAISRILFKN